MDFTFSIKAIGLKIEGRVHLWISLIVFLLYHLGLWVLGRMWLHTVRGY